jgi:hypothetical protein
VVKRYTPEQVMLDFLPAEASRVTSDMPAEDRRASLALLDNRQLNGHPGDGLPTQSRLDSMHDHISEVMRGWRVREKPFTSSAPMFGGLIVRMRERLNNLSTRWYVRPILQQQVDYNASVARALREMSAQLAEFQARVGLQAVLTAGLTARERTLSTEELTSEVESLRVRLEQLEQETEHLRDGHGVA